MYLGRWHQWLKEACALRGWAFVVNPPNLAEVDVIVAFRDGQWDGWMCREWKSGVKIVNAIAAGRPIITQDCAAAHEIGARITEDRLDEALDLVSPLQFRLGAVATSNVTAWQFTLDAVTARYRQILAGVLEAPCTA